jgi:FMN phosphatase YigB (HAD superfamily)
MTPLDQDLGSVRLITFSIFGTLVDWRSVISQALPGQWRTFSHRVETFTTHEWTKQVSTLMQELGLNAQISEDLTLGLGEAPLWSDAAALRTMRQTTALGCVSSSTRSHQLDVCKQLGFVWDEIWTSDRPGLKRAKPDLWSDAVETVTKARGLAPRQWLHVASQSSLDLKPARELGLLTAFLPRPGSTDPMTGSEHADLVVSDLWQLCSLLQDAGKQSVTYRVSAHCNEADEATRLIQWMRNEHGKDLLAVSGCISFTTSRVRDSSVLNEYVFTSKAALDHYVRVNAPKLRARGIELFPHVKFERDEISAQLSGERRKTRDFVAWPRP